jgi:biopolymer transport protein ExbB/TolQ
VAETLLQNTSLPREEFEKAVNGRIESETVNMERNLIVLGTMSNIAPLMGLFGTVVGIIRSFRDIAVTGSGGSSVIAMGVSEALLTTAVGIVIAVIATVFYNALIRRIRVRVNQMEEVRQELTALLVRPRTQAPAPRSADGHPQRRAA